MSDQLGSHVRAFRKRAGLTQAQAADLAGMSAAALRDLEQGRVVAPRPVTLRRLAEALRLPVAEAEELLRSGQPDQHPSGELWLQVLGPLVVRVNGAAVELGSARQRLLLGSLALAPGTTVTPATLVELVWGAAPPENATDVLRFTMSRLRRRLPDQVLVADQGGYRLAVAENQLDALMFRRLVRQARRSRQDGDPDRACRGFDSAMALWRGDALADLPALRAHPAVAELAGEWQAVVLEYADVSAALGRHEVVLPWLQRVAQVDPLHEPAHARLMVALAASGQREAALACFDTLRDRLSDELGVDPGPELVEAHHRVRRDKLADPEPAAPVSAYGQLPADLVEFTGRTGELRTLRERLPADPGASTAVVISSVEGMGGVGKTRLAVHFAHQLLAAGGYADVQLYVDLRAHSDAPPADPAAVLSVFLLLLGVPGNQIPDDPAGRAALYRDRLADKRALVLLDNAADAAQVQPLLPASPTSLVLITSRRSLALDGAQVVPLDVLPPAEAEDLLARVAGGERVANEPAAARQLVELCGHLPLAVSLAGRRLRARPTWRLADLADQLAEAGDRLSALAAGSRQLQAIFSLSYHAIDPEARRLFRLLSLHPGDDFAASSVAALAGTTPASARRLLDLLADEHLVTVVTGERYRLHDLLREYAGEVVRAEEPEPARHAAVTRLLEYYLHTAARATDAVAPYRVTVPLVGTPPAHPPALPDQPAAVRWLDDERASLLTAVRLAAGGGWPTHAWQLAHELRSYQSLYGHTRDWLAAHELALAAVRGSGDVAGEVAIRTSLGNARLRWGQPQESTEHLVRALALQEQAGGDPVITRTILTALGAACMELARFRDALRYLRRALTLCEGQDAHRATAVHHNLAVGLRILGRLQEAWEHIQQALTLTEQTGDTESEVMIQCNLGEVCRRQGRHGEAVGHGERALALATEHGLRPRQVHALRLLGNTNRDLARLVEARRFLDEALQIVHTDDGDAQDESDVLIDLGATCRDAGDLDAAEEHIRQGLVLATETSAPYREARALDGLAKVYERMGDADRAEAHREQAKRGFARLGVPEPG